MSDGTADAGHTVGRRAGPVAFVLIGGAVIGSAGAASSYAPDAASSLSMGGLRLIGGSLTLVVLLRTAGGSWAGVRRVCRAWTVWAMGIGTAGFQPLFFGAIERAGVAISTLVAIGSMPLFAGLVSWLVRRNPPTRRWLLATAIAVTGLALRSWGQLGDGDALGIGMALIAGFASGCYVVGSKTQLDRGAAAVEVAAAVYTIGAAVLLPLVLLEPLDWVGEPVGFAVVAYLGVVTMGLGNWASLHGMRHISPAPGATLQLSDPVTATVLGVALLGEPITVLGLAGVGLVATGIVMQARAAGVPDTS